MLSNQAESVALETYALRSCNYLGRMVDSSSQPYFNVFWTEPAEAAHDWPDFGDVMSRQLQAAIMARHMTGTQLSIEPIWLDTLLARIDAETGLLIRPETNYSKPVADGGGQALTLYALVTAYLDRSDPHLRHVIEKMVTSLLERTQHGISLGQGFVGGFIIKSLMAAVRNLDCESALELARLLVKRVFDDEPLFTSDNRFLFGGHMHGNLRTLVGVADYALYTHDTALFARVDALYQYVRSRGTRFGFLPEVDGRKGDIVACETCALMDYIGLGTTLANHGHPEYWDDVERTVRNQLIESQVVDASWLHGDPNRPDSQQFTWRDVGDRMVGGYAGWSSPTHILAARETLGAHWGGPELHGKTRAFQNCCGGSGTHAFFIVWKNAVRFASGRLSVNMHFDKLIPEAEIRSFQPYQGLLTIALKTACEVRIRIPDFVNCTEMVAQADGKVIESSCDGHFMALGKHPAGTFLKVTYPLPTNEEGVVIGNSGFRQYHYQVMWKGNTVIEMLPRGNDASDMADTAYSDFERGEVSVFYGEQGPGRLYQRAQYRSNALPQPALLHEDDGLLNLWLLEEK